jgi:hypothetical protein
VEEELGLGSGVSVAVDRVGSAVDRVGLAESSALLQAHNKKIRNRYPIILIDYSTPPYYVKKTA